MMMRRFAQRMIAAALALSIALGPALASQGQLYNPTTGTLSGLNMVTTYNAAFAALVTCNSGATAPANATGAAPAIGQCWDDTSATPTARKVYDGADWIIQGWRDATNNLWLAPVGVGRASVASATTVDLCSTALNPYNIITITGTTTVTAFGSSCKVGQLKLVVFSGIAQITYNATSMILPTAANITTQAGDRMLAEYLGSGNWRIDLYMRADGTSLATTAVFTGGVFFNSAITPTTLAANTNNWAPTNLATSNVIRAQASAPVNLTGITAPATNGQRLSLQNVGTNNITLTVEDANSTAANRFKLPRPFALRPDQALPIIYDGTSARWRIDQDMPTFPVSAEFKNLKIAYATTVTATLTADALTVEDANGALTRLRTVSITADITASGANGIDTGSRAASTWYSFNVVYNPATNTSAALLSTQSTCLAATLPSGYTYCARMGWIRTDASGTPVLVPTLQYGRSVQYVVTAGTTTTRPPSIASGATGAGSLTSPTTPATQSLTGIVPPTASRIHLLAVNKIVDAALSSVLVSPSSGWFGVAQGGPKGANGVNWPLYLDSGVAENTALWMTLESTNIYYWSTQAGGGIACLGYEDNI